MLGIGPLKAQSTQTPPYVTQPNFLSCHNFKTQAIIMVYYKKLKVSKQINECFLHNSPKSLTRD